MATLTPQQEIYCTERAKGATIDEAARAAGVVRQTGSDWNHHPDVEARIDELQKPARHRAMRILRAKAERAAERLTELIEPGYNLGKSAGVNYQAALSTLKLIGIAEAQDVNATITDNTLSDRQKAEALLAILARAQQEQ